MNLGAFAGCLMDTQNGPVKIFFQGTGAICLHQADGYTPDGSTLITHAGLPNLSHFAGDYPAVFPTRNNSGLL